MPDRLTEKEVREHNVTHTPPKPWCPYCVMGTGTRAAHSKLRQEVADVDVVSDKVPMISVDYIYLYEKWNKSTLVMVDDESGRTWAYALKGKTILSGEGWMQRRNARDIDKAGHKDVNLRFKSDQEASIVALQQEVQRLRTGKFIPINSPVGEFDCNGRLENAIRRVQDKVRTLKAKSKVKPG